MTPDTDLFVAMMVNFQRLTTDGVVISIEYRKVVRRNLCTAHSSWKMYTYDKRGKQE